MSKFITVKNFTRIFSILLIIVILMFVTNYLLMKRSTQGLYEQMKENNRLIVSNIIQSFDDSFKDINNLIYSIDTLPFDFNKSSEVNYNNYLLYKEMNKLVNLSSSNDYIEEVAVSFAHSDVAITSAGTIHFDEFLNDQYRNREKNSMFWHSFFREEPPLQVFPSAQYMKRISGNTYQRKNLIAVAGHSPLSSKNIIVFLDVDALLDRVNQKSMMEDTAFVILDNQNNMILSTEENFNLASVIQNQFVDEGVEAVLKNQSYEYIVYKSRYNEFTYINRVPVQYSAVLSITNDQQRIMLYSIILTLILLLFLSYWLFRPINKISKLIGGDPNWSSIYDHIDQLKMNFRTVKNKEIFIEKQLNENLFLNVFNPIRQKQDEDLKAALAKYVPTKYFLLSKLSFQPNENQSLSRKEIKGIIIQRFQELTLNVNVFSSGEDEFLLIICVNSPSDREITIQYIYEIVDELQDLYDCTFLAIISKLYNTSVEHVQLAYQEVKNTENYRNIGWDGPIFDVEDVHYTVDVYFPIEEMEILSNLPVSGNEKDAIRLMNEIISENVERNIQRHQLNGILQSLLFYMKRYLKVSDEELQELYELEMQFDHNIRVAKNIDEVKDSLISIVKYIAKKSRQEESSKLDRNFIIQYIELHYMDNLYLEHMANVTGTSSKYFSKYFKKAFGVNFVDYLHRVRINHAKVLLRSENSTIAEIGEKVGYLNATTFASTFKKYTGVTPTQYRNEIVNAEQNSS